MSNLFRLAHVTDPHFRSFDGARIGDFLGKRAVGAVNLVVNRRRKHKMELLDALADDLRQQAPDHVAITGDLSNVSLEGEWQAALRWIAGLRTSPDAVTVIPGNHDTYVPQVVDDRAFERLFAAYQTADTDVAADADGGGNDYPFVRMRGPLALIALNSCVATGDLGAWGQLGAAQLDRAERILNAPALRQRQRVVLLHHPPVRHKGLEERNLKDRQAFADMLSRSGAALVLHGHDHQDEAATLLGPGASAIPVVGAGSASYAGGPARRARYNLYEFDAAGITAVVRAHDETADAFREVERRRLV